MTTKKFSRKGFESTACDIPSTKIDKYLKNFQYLIKKHFDCL